MENLLSNAGFEADWAESKSHRCLVVPHEGGPYRKDVGNIFVPSGGWLFWFRHQEGIWDQPEGRDAHRSHDAMRVKAGEKAYMYFAFGRRYDAGLLQRVPVPLGARVRVSGWAHGWSTHPLEGYESVYSNPRFSCGVGVGPASIPVVDAPPLTGDPWNDAVSNLSFYLGLGLMGETNPLDPSVVWGQGIHNYNAHAPVPPLEGEAQAEHVTVFLRSRAMWAFKQGDSYWDEIRLELVLGGRGLPREQYERTYVLLPPSAGVEWVRAVVDAGWEEKRYTIGGSADDAGIGDLDVRHVIAVNPQEWQDDLSGFFRQHYPAVLYESVTAVTPEALEVALREMQ